MKYNIKNVDYLDFLKTLDNKSVDFICIDPPYGKINGMQLQGQKQKINWDINIDWKEMFAELNRVIKDGGTIAIFGQNPTYAKMILSNKKDYKYEYIWIKNNCAQGFHADKMPLIYTENIAIFINEKADRVFTKIGNSKEIDKKRYPLRHYSQQLQKYIIEKYKLKSRKAIYQNMPLHKGKLDRRLEFFFFFNGTLFNPPSKIAYDILIDNFNLREWNGFKELEELTVTRTFNKEEVVDAQALSLSHKNTLYFSKEKQSHHPTQKPIRLLEHLIKTYTKRGDVVLDCFMGSGSTGVASLKNGRWFLGCEIDKEYFEIAKNRIEND